MDKGAWFIENSEIRDKPRPPPSPMAIVVFYDISNILYLLLLGVTK